MNLLIFWEEYQRTKNHGKEDLRFTYKIKIMFHTTQNNGDYANAETKCPRELN